MSIKESTIWIITGPFQVGKTYFCNNLINQARARGYKLAGMFCPPVFVNQVKTAITIEDLQTHERKTLATKRTTETRGLLTDHWVFDEEVMLWANQSLANANNCDILLIDELGPLEFNRGQGWQNGLLAIENGDYKIAVVIIRPVLVETALKRWPKAKVFELSARLTEVETSNQIEKILSEIDR
ncbi:MAG: nucleoside-triphosphatase [Anaerolineaceae bacterium]